jgi:hypothetical protein
MVEERGELFLLPLPCGLPYAAQRLGHANPALRPVRALMIRVPLGRRPWLAGSANGKSQTLTPSGACKSRSLSYHPRITHTVCPRGYGLRHVFRAWWET